MPANLSRMCSSVRRVAENGACARRLPRSSRMGRCRPTASKSGRTLSTVRGGRIDGCCRTISKSRRCKSAYESCRLESVVVVLTARDFNLGRVVDYRITSATIIDASLLCAARLIERQKAGQDFVLGGFGGGVGPAVGGPDGAVQPLVGDTCPGGALVGEAADGAWLSTSRRRNMPSGLGLASFLIVSNRGKHHRDAHSQSAVLRDTVPKLSNCPQAYRLSVIAHILCSE